MTRRSALTASLALVTLVACSPEGAPGPVSTTSPTSTTSTASPTTTTSEPAPFTPDDVVVGASGVDYVDPEFLVEGDAMAFLDAQRDGNLWVARIDPRTGRLRSQDGRDLLVDTGPAALGNTGLTLNGPEWGLDRDGPTILYTKVDPAGLPQVWRAEAVLDGPMSVEMLTRSATGAHTPLARRDPDATSTPFLFKAAPTGRGAGPVVWADETDPARTVPIDGVVASAYLPTWIPGTDLVAYLRRSGPNGLDLARFDPATGRSTFLTTGEPGVKKNVIAFEAPELGGELVLGYVVDAATLVLFRHQGGTWTRWTTLAPPDPARPHLYSPEVFHADGATHIAVQMKDVNLAEAGNDAAIWVMTVGPDPGDHSYRRIDEGASSGRAARRFEPEVVTGTDEPFVFYSERADNRTLLRRATTGIPTRR